MNIPRTLDEALDAGTPALVVYDMRVGIVGQLPDGPEVVERVGAVLTAVLCGLVGWESHRDAEDRHRLRHQAAQPR